MVSQISHITSSFNYANLLIRRLYFICAGISMLFTEFYESASGENEMFVVHFQRCINTAVSENNLQT